MQYKTIISNCHIGKEFDKIHPEHYFYHTIPIRNVLGDEEFVTVAFHTKDDFKTHVEDVNNLQIGDKSMSDIFTFTNALKKQDLFYMDDDSNLWKAKLFPTAKTMKESFDKTISMIRGDPKQDLNGIRYSMNDLMKKRDKQRILAFRTVLYQSILASL